VPISLAESYRWYGSDGLEEAFEYRSIAVPTRPGARDDVGLIDDARAHSRNKSVIAVNKRYAAARRLTERGTAAWAHQRLSRKRRALRVPATGEAQILFPI
jgi:hypothetical protein